MVVGGGSLISHKVMEVDPSHVVLVHYKSKPRTPSAFFCHMRMTSCSRQSGRGLSYSTQPKGLPDIRLPPSRTGRRKFLWGIRHPVCGASLMQCKGTKTNTLCFCLDVCSCSCTCMDLNLLPCGVEETKIWFCFKARGMGQCHVSHTFLWVADINCEFSVSLWTEPSLLSSSPISSIVFEGGFSQEQCKHHIFTFVVIMWNLFFWERNTWIGET